MKKPLRLYYEGYVEYDFQSRIVAGKCLHFTQDEQGVHWCERDVAKRALHISVHLENVDEDHPHVLNLLCIKHLSALARLQAKTLQWFLIDTQKNAQTEVVLWNCGGLHRRRWAYCFNHREKNVEWNTHTYTDFISRAEALEHAYHTYTLYGRDTPIEQLSLEVLRERVEEIDGIRRTAFA